MDAPDSVRRGVLPPAGAERPLPNTYWIEAGRLLAGEYPGAMKPADTEARLKRLLAAGIETFVDLTQPDELPGYSQVLARLDAGAGHRRYAIIDHGLPDKPALIAAALDRIDAELKAGRGVYVHCRAGVGRTGTVLGCWLIRHGLRSEEALERLALLWQQSERSRVIPQIPETSAQAGYVEQWAEPSRSPGGLAERVRGMLYGLAAGEAAAGTEAGAWGSQTAMTLLLTQSLIAREGNDLADQLQRYQEWQQRGLQGASLAIPVPATVRRAIAGWLWSRKVYAGSHDPAALDPQGLARTAAIAGYFSAAPADALEAAVESQRTTHQAPLVLEACRCYTALLLEALSGAPKAQVLSLRSGEVGALLRARPLKMEIEMMLGGPWPDSRLTEPATTATGALAAAVHAFARTRDYAEGLQLVTGSSRKAAAAAAVFGALAGAHYGAGALPRPLLRDLADIHLLDDAARALVPAAGT